MNDSCQKCGAPYTNTGHQCDPKRWEKLQIEEKLEGTRHSAEYTAREPTYGERLAYGFHLRNQSTGE